MSKHFWPAVKPSDTDVPGQFQEIQDLHAQEIAVFKPDKKLKWLPHMGKVHLELQLDDRIVQADVPPLEAALIELFSRKDQWTPDEFIAGVGVIDRRAAFKGFSSCG